jgi:hypothetical protein
MLIESRKVPFRGRFHAYGEVRAKLIGVVPRRDAPLRHLDLSQAFTTNKPTKKPVQTNDGTRPAHSGGVRLIESINRVDANPVHMRSHAHFSNSVL